MGFQSVSCFDIKRRGLHFQITRSSFDGGMVSRSFLLKDSAKRQFAGVNRVNDSLILNRML